LLLLKGLAHVGWLFPRPPLDPFEKAWVETRLLALTRYFGFARLLETPVILPTPELFGGPWDASPAAVQRLTQRLADHLRIDNPGLKLEFCAQDHACGEVWVAPRERSASCRNNCTIPKWWGGLGS